MRPAYLIQKKLLALLTSQNVKMHIPKHISSLIKRGEDVSLDFKQTVNNYTKIAKSIVSFANTKGGTLLVGVRDNGTISGVSPEEDKHVLQHAINFYCKPSPLFSIKEWVVEGKYVLECIIERGDEKPYYSKDSDKKWWVYVRVNDACLLASKTTVDFMHQQNSSKPIRIEYGKVEEGILALLNTTERVTLKQVSKKLNISYRRASRTIVKLMSAGVIRSHTTEKAEFYTAS